MDDDIFSAAVLSKLPLANAVWRVLHFTLADSWLDDLWQRERGRCYEQILKFSTLARLVTDALGTARRQWPPSLRARAGGGLAAGLDRLDLREARQPPVAPQRGAARGRYPALARTLAREPGRRSVSRCLPAGRATKSSAPTARRSSTSNGCSSRCAACRQASWGAGVGRLELADRHGGGHGRAPRRGGRRGEPSPKSCCRRWPRQPAAGRGWWCWIGSTAT